MSTMTVDLVGLLNEMDAGSRVAREIDGRWYNWRKDRRGYWKLAGSLVWLTSAEMANRPLLVQHQPAPARMDSRPEESR